MQPSDRVRAMLAVSGIDYAKRGYRNAVDLLARIRRLADAAGTPKRFEALLTRVRAARKPKRNLMAGSPQSKRARYHERRVPTRSARVGMVKIGLWPARRRSMSK